VNQYLARLASAGIDRRERLQPALRKYVEERAEAAA
jgi:hypothetical protein